MSDARRIALAVSPDARLRADLRARLEAHLIDRLPADGLTVPSEYLVVEGEPVLLDPDLADQLFLIVAEAVTNAAKHAPSARVRVTLAYGPRRKVTLTVDDDGPGFDPASAAQARSDGSGISNMRDRAARLGSTLEIDSSPGRGTRVRVAVTSRLYAVSAGSDPVWSDHVD